MINFSGQPVEGNFFNGMEMAKKFKMKGGTPAFFNTLPWPFLYLKIPLTAFRYVWNRKARTVRAATVVLSGAPENSEITSGWKAGINISCGEHSLWV